MTAAGPDDAERLDWLRLIRSERVGPRTFRGLLAEHGSAAAALDALPGIARRLGRTTLHVASRAEIEREMEGSRRLGVTFVTLPEPAYPSALRAIDTAPPVIAVRGTLSILSRPAVAIVGSRNASAAGGTLTDRLAAGLGRDGFVIVSGLARGIDTRAHRAALVFGTVAVLAGGHDRVYPSENAALLERIVAEGGAALSEMPLGWEPRARDFPRRNRLVSGLALGTVVVEAARRSGSLITARFALEQGREVFAVPGSPLDPRSEGTNDLIRAGATLCATPDHVSEALAPLVGGIFPSAEPHRPAALEEPDRLPWFWDELAESAADAPDGDLRPAPAPADGDERGRVRAGLSAAPVSVDDLARGTDLPVRTVLRHLVELELGGTVERLPNGTVALRHGHG